MQYFCLNHHKEHFKTYIELMCAIVWLVVRQCPHWLNRGVVPLCGRYFLAAGTFMIQRTRDWTFLRYYVINCLIHEIHSISTVINASQSQLEYRSQPERSFINNNKFHMMNWKIQYDKKLKHWKSSDWWGFSLWVFQWFTASKSAKHKVSEENIHPSLSTFSWHLVSVFM